MINNKVPLIKYKRVIAALGLKCINGNIVNVFFIHDNTSILLSRFRALVLH